MNIEVKLKTGFFKTMSYSLKMNETLLILSPLEPSAKEILLPKEDILTFTLWEKKSPEFEIQTRGNLYHGSITENIDPREIYAFLRANFYNKTIFEYEL